MKKETFQSNKALALCLCIVILLCSIGLAWAQEIGTGKPYQAKALTLTQGQIKYDLLEGITYDHIKYILAVTNSGGFDIDTPGTYEIQYLLSPVSGTTVPPSQSAAPTLESAPSAGSGSSLESPSAAVIEPPSSHSSPTNASSKPSSGQIVPGTTPNISTAVKPASDNKTKPSEDKPIASDDKTKPSEDKPVASDDKTKPSGDKPVASDDKTKPSGDKPVASDDKTKPSADKPVASDDKTKPSADKPVASDGKTKPSTDKPVAPDGKTKPSADKPVASDGKTKPSADKPVAFDGKTKPIPSPDKANDSLSPAAPNQDSFAVSPNSSARSSGGSFTLGVSQVIGVSLDPGAEGFHEATSATADIKPTAPDAKPETSNVSSPSGSGSGSQTSAQQSSSHGTDSSKALGTGSSAAPNEKAPEPISFTRKVVVKPAVICADIRMDVSNKSDQSKLFLGMDYDKSQYSVTVLSDGHFAADRIDEYHVSYQLSKIDADSKTKSKTEGNVGELERYIWVTAPGATFTAPPLFIDSSKVSKDKNGKPAWDLFSGIEYDHSRYEISLVNSNDAGKIAKALTEGTNPGSQRIMYCLIQKNDAGNGGKEQSADSSRPNSQTGNDGSSQLNSQTGRSDGKLAAVFGREVTVSGKVDDSLKIIAPPLIVTQGAIQGKNLLTGVSVEDGHGNQVENVTPVVVDRSQIDNEMANFRDGGAHYPVMNVPTAPVSNGIATGSVPTSITQNQNSIPVPSETQRNGYSDTRNFELTGSDAMGQDLYAPVKPPAKIVAKSVEIPADLPENTYQITLAVKNPGTGENVAATRMVRVGTARENPNAIEIREDDTGILNWSNDMGNMMGNLSYDKPGHYTVSLLKDYTWTQNDTNWFYTMLHIKPQVTPGPKTVIITGKDPYTGEIHTLTMDSDMYIPYPNLPNTGTFTIENIKLDSTNSVRNIYASGSKLTMGEGIIINPDKHFTVYGGTDEPNNVNTDLTVISGSYSGVYGGGNNNSRASSFTQKTKLTIGKNGSGPDIAVVCGSDQSSDSSNDSGEVFVLGGTIDNLFGAKHYASSTHVNVTGGTAKNLYGFREGATNNGKTAVDISGGGQVLTALSGAAVPQSKTPDGNIVFNLHNNQTIANVNGFSSLNIDSGHVLTVSQKLNSNLVEYNTTQKFNYAGTINLGAGSVLTLPSSPNTAGAISTKGPGAVLKLIRPSTAPATPLLTLTTTEPTINLGANPLTLKYTDETGKKAASGDPLLAFSGRKNFAAASYLSAYFIPNFQNDLAIRGYENTGIVSLAPLGIQLTKPGSAAVKYTNMAEAFQAIKAQAPGAPGAYKVTLLEDYMFTKDDQDALTALTGLSAANRITLTGADPGKPATHYHWSFYPATNNTIYLPYAADSQTGVSFVMENIRFPIQAKLYAQGSKLTMGDGIDMGTATGGNLYGGMPSSNSKTVHTDLTVQSGQYNNVYGGNESGSVPWTGDVSVTVKGGTKGAPNILNLYGAVSSQTGTVTVVVQKGTVTKLCGVGGGTLAGKVNLTVSGGEVRNVLVHEFGDTTGMTTVNVNGGAVTELCGSSYDGTNQTPRTTGPVQFNIKSKQKMATLFGFDTLSIAPKAELEVVNINSYSKAKTYKNDVILGGESLLRLNNISIGINSLTTTGPGAVLEIDRGVWGNTLPIATKTSVMGLSQYPLTLAYTKGSQTWAMAGDSVLQFTGNSALAAHIEYYIPDFPDHLLLKGNPSTGIISLATGKIVLTSPDNTEHTYFTMAEALEECKKEALTTPGAYTVSLLQDYALTSDDQTALSAMTGLSKTTTVTITGKYTGTKLSHALTAPSGTGSVIFPYYSDSAASPQFVIQNMKFNSSSVERYEGNIYASGSKLTMAGGVVMEGKNQDAWRVYGGTDAGDTRQVNTDLTVNSGSYHSVYGGGYDVDKAGRTGTTKVTIGATASEQPKITFVNGAGWGSKQMGNTSVIMKAGHVTTVLGSDNWNFPGTATVNLDGGKVDNIATAEKRTGAPQNTFTLNINSDQTISSIKDFTGMNVAPGKKLIVADFLNGSASYPGISYYRGTVALGAGSKLILPSAPCTAGAITASGTGAALEFTRNSDQIREPLTLTGADPLPRVADAGHGSASGLPKYPLTLQYTAETKAGAKPGDLLLKFTGNKEAAGHTEDFTPDFSNLMLWANVANGQISLAYPAVGLQTKSGTPEAFGPVTYYKNVAEALNAVGTKGGGYLVTVRQDQYQLTLKDGIAIATKGENADLTYTSQFQITSKDFLQNGETVGQTVTQTVLIGDASPSGGGSPGPEPKISFGAKSTDIANMILKFQQSGGNIFANGHPLTVGKGVDVLSASATFPILYGGAENAMTGATEVTLGSGSFGGIYGGGKEAGATVTGNTSLTVTGGTLYGPLYGGGQIGNVTGDSYVAISGGDLLTPNKNANLVVGGGQDGNVGNCHVTISGGRASLPVVVAACDSGTCNTNSIAIRPSSALSISLPKAYIYGGGLHAGGRTISFSTIDIEGGDHYATVSGGNQDTDPSSVSGDLAGRRVINFAGPAGSAKAENVESFTRLNVGSAEKGFTLGVSGKLDSGRTAASAIPGADDHFGRTGTVSLGGYSVLNLSGAGQTPAVGSIQVDDGAAADQVSPHLHLAKDARQTYPLYVSAGNDSVKGKLTLGLLVTPSVKPAIGDQLLVFQNSASIDLNQYYNDYNWFPLKQDGNAVELGSSVYPQLDDYGVGLSEPYELGTTGTSSLEKSLSFLFKSVDENNKQAPAVTSAYVDDKPDPNPGWVTAGSLPDTLKPFEVTIDPTPSVGSDGTKRWSGKTAPIGIQEWEADTGGQGGQKLKEYYVHMRAENGAFRTVSLDVQSPKSEGSCQVIKESSEGSNETQYLFTVPFSDRVSGLVGYTASGLNQSAWYLGDTGKPQELKQAYREALAESMDPGDQTVPHTNLLIHYNGTVPSAEKYASNITFRIAASELETGEPTTKVVYLFVKDEACNTSVLSIPVSKSRIDVSVPLQVGVIALRNPEGEAPASPKVLAPDCYVTNHNAAMKVKTEIAGVEVNGNNSLKFQGYLNPDAQYGSDGINLLLKPIPDAGNTFEITPVMALPHPGADQPLPLELGSMGGDAGSLNQLGFTFQAQFDPKQIVSTKDWSTCTLTYRFTVIK